MRVLFVDREGAASIWGLMITIACRLESEGWQTGIVAMQEPGRHGLPSAAGSLSLGIHRIPVRAKRGHLDLLRQWHDFSGGFRSLLGRLRPDVVHVNFAVPGIWARIAAHRARVPWVVSTQHELRGSLAPHLRFGLWATSGCVDVHAYISDAVAASFGRRNATDHNRMSHVIIRNGIDIASVRRVANEERTTIKGRIVAAGRLVREKGHETLLRALPRVLAAVPEAHVVIVGAGPEESRLRALTGELGIRECVHFEGWLPREHLWRLYATAAVAAFASDGTQEGFGLALAEAAAAGVPLAVSRIAAFREVLADDAEAALWFAPKDVSGAADALSGALRVSPSKDRAAMVQRAHRRVEERASEYAMTTGYSALYRSLREAAQ